MPEVTLTVGGQSFAGWKAVRILRGIETISGSFDLEVSDRWAGQEDPWPIAEEDDCTLSVDGGPVLNGTVDRRHLSYGPQEHTFRVSGRDRTGVLVDSSAVLTHWEFLSMPVPALVKQICKPFGIPVTTQPGLKLAAPPQRITIDPGEKAFDFIDRVCRIAGVLPISDGLGGLLLTRAGTARCPTALEQGKNILAAAGDFDATGRYRTYRVFAQHRGADGFYGDQVASISATAEDQGVRRGDRVLLIRPEANANQAQAKKRAEWEATVRAARGDSVAITVAGWQQADGSLWPINSIARVRSPLIGIDGDMLISQAIYSVDGSQGFITELSLRRPDAFTPEPFVPPPGTWKELTGGV